MKDKDNAAMTGATVRLWLIRPVRDGIDQKMEMTEKLPGVYFATIAVPEMGLWQARFEAEKQGQRYQVSQRMEF